MKYLLLSLLLVEQSLQLPYPVAEPETLPSPTTKSHVINLTRRSPQSSDWSAWPSGAASSTSTGGAAGTGTPTGEESSPSSSPTAVTPGNIIDFQRSVYLFPIEIEGQTFDVELDTGSSDTWVPRTGYQCYQSANIDTAVFSGLYQDPSVCGFATTYTTGSGFAEQDIVDFFTCYGANARAEGRCVTGPLAQANVGLGELTVSNQFIGAAEKSSFKTRASQGESGILGMAFGALTFGRYTSDNSNFPYKPIMQTLFESGQVQERQFSLALSRDDAATGNGGIFTIGGIPDIHAPEVNTSTDWYSSKTLQVFESRNEDSLSYYSFEVDSYYVDGTAYDPGLQVIVDSGFNILNAPLATAELMNSLWSPPPTGEVRDGLIVIECDPQYTGKVGINLGGRTFFVDPAADMWSYYGDVCVSLIQGVDTSKTDIVVLGDPFLKSVLAVFNWDKELLSFYPRQYYRS